MASPSALVVGAGVGGLVAALELAARGVDVTVLERAGQPGGKMREVQVAGQAMDAGPTVFTMRWVFDELLESIGESLDSQLSLLPLQALARHVWGDGQPLDLFTDIERSADAIGLFSGAAEAHRFRDFCARAGAMYDVLERPFLRGSRPNPLSLFARAPWRDWPALMRISPFATLWGALGDHFHDPRLRQLFGRYATYCGSSPFLAPATLMLVAHVERTGVWQVAGGMHGVAQMLARLAVARGARLRLGEDVQRIVVERGRACGVELASGERLGADAVVFNGDAAALAGGLLGPATQRAMRRQSATAHSLSSRSLSAITWNLVARTAGLPLLHHTVCFSNDYGAEFDAIVQRGELPASPTIYVCAQDRGDIGSAAPTGPERLLCLVNAPARGDATPLTEQEIERCEQQTFQRLAQCGLRIEATPQRTVVTAPADFHRLFPATGGALYGQASHGWRASFTRPTQRTAIPGLVLAGGSTHPGPGVPMAALSGRLAAATVLAQWKTPRASTWPSRPLATPGGTSTP